MVVLQEACGQGRGTANSNRSWIRGVAEHDPGIESHQSIRIIDRIAGRRARPLITAPPVVGGVHRSVDIVEPSSSGCRVAHNPAEVDVNRLRWAGTHWNSAAGAR